MQVAWTAHRFSGGALALDVTNTVVLRGDPERSFDRFDDAEEIGRFADAATIFRADELAGRPLDVKRGEEPRSAVIELRESIDRLFRDAVTRGALSVDAYADMLGRCAEALAGCRGDIGRPGMPFGDPGSPLAFEAGVALSALSLTEPQTLSRIRICRNCRWLFVDRSRNSSRVWCDMTVCGNRTKARRHYRRRTGTEETNHA